MEAQWVSPTAQSRHSPRIGIQCLLLAKTGLPGHVASTSALPPTAEIRTDVPRRPLATSKPTFAGGGQGEHGVRERTENCDLASEWCPNTLWKPVARPERPRARGTWRRCSPAKAMLRRVSRLWRKHHSSNACPDDKGHHRTNGKPRRPTGARPVTPVIDAAARA